MTPPKSTKSLALDGSDDILPAVPPKSPRTLGRQRPVSRDPRYLDNAANLAVQMTADPGRNAQDSEYSHWWTPQQCNDGVWPQDNTSDTWGGRLPSPEDTLSRGSIAFDCRTEQSLPGNNSPVELEAIPANKTSPVMGRQSPPETSMIDRARPTKRIAGVIKRNPGKSVRTDSSMEMKSIADLPAGICVAEAPYKLSRSQTRNLRDEAIKRAEQFEILSGKDVEALSRVSLYGPQVGGYVTYSH